MRAHDLAGSYFLVCHADESVWATATAGDDVDLLAVVEALEETKAAMLASGELLPFDSDDHAGSTASVAAPLEHEGI